MAISQKGIEMRSFRVEVPEDKRFTLSQQGPEAINGSVSKGPKVWRAKSDNAVQTPIGGHGQGGFVELEFYIGGEH
ncbi:hypothetical protein K432DRAFT_381355 [Lepidopterella palustris CBS 459.81]|uniref:Uncharacterized protein n=1 Tax=Lepidopterella palustris CBS 459.81 TaxID=1314670 RepID=A0A8E2ECT1_9PEZI|nr:hypothetical protein K432DRAFT_381355 [Lepidopterella palustris CBS 459.81]